MSREKISFSIPGFSLERLDWAVEADRDVLGIV